jgi:hypothetical protein
MRRFAGFVLIGLGAFLVSAAVLARFYVLDQVRIIPIDQFAQTVAPGTGTYLDPGTLTEKRADLVATRRLRGDVAASNDTTGVWDVSVVLDTADGTFVRASLDRVAFDRKSAESVHCCGEAVDGEAARHEGVSYKFPFSTPKEDIPFWDVNARKAYPARYVSEEKVQGLTTDKFIQQVPVHELRTLEVPGSLVGESAPSFQAPVVYSNTRTVWVEPKTGIIVKGSEQTRTTLQDSTGQDRATALEATLTFDEATQRAQADLAKDSIRKLSLVEWIVPVVALVLGLAFAAVGWLLVRGRRQPEAPAGDRGEELVPAGGPSEEAEPERDRQPVRDQPVRDASRRP